MSCLSELTDRIRGTTDLGALLDVAYDAFEDLLTVVRGHRAGFDDYLSLPLLRVVALAADARDIVGRAPSLPSRRRSMVAAAEAPHPSKSAEHVAHEIVALSEHLAARLADVGGAAPDPADQAACSAAAGCAREIYAHLIGREP